MSNESELFLSRRIPENHIQVQKEKENLVFACRHSPINDGISTDVLDAMNSNVSLDETLLSHTVNLNAYFRLPFLTSGTSTLSLRCLRCLLSIGERCPCMVQSLTYLGGQRQHVWRIKWRLESRHLIENTSRGPNVCFLTVRLALDNFRTETNDEIYTLNADVKREKKALIWVSMYLAQKC